MGFLDDLARGAAQLLEDAGVGDWVDTEEAIPLAATGAVIVVGLSPAKPDRVVTVTAYGVEDTVDSHGTYGLQVRSRGEATGLGSASDLDDRAFLALHRPRGVQVGPITVASLVRRSGPAPMGQDQAGRTELTSNFHALVGRAITDPWS